MVWELGPNGPGYPMPVDPLADLLGSQRAHTSVCTRLRQITDRPASTRQVDQLTKPEIAHQIHQLVGDRRVLGAQLIGPSSAPPAQDIHVQGEAGRFEELRLRGDAAVTRVSLSPWRALDGQDDPPVRA